MNLSHAACAASPEALLLSGAPFATALRAALVAAKAAAAETMPAPVEEPAPKSTVRARPAPAFSPWLKPTIAELRAARKIHGKDVEAYFARVGLAVYADGGWRLTSKGQWAFSCARFRSGEGYCEQSRAVRGEFWDLEKLGMIKKQARRKGQWDRYKLTAKGARLAALVLGGAR